MTMEKHLTGALVSSLASFPSFLCLNKELLAAERVVSTLTTPGPGSCTGREAHDLVVGQR